MEQPGPFAPVPGGPLGEPEPVATIPEADRPAEEGAERPASATEVKELRRLELLVGRVGEEIKEALSRRDPPPAPPPAPNVVVHRVETRIEKPPAPLEEAPLASEPAPPAPRSRLFWAAGAAGAALLFGGNLFLWARIGETRRDRQALAGRQAELTRAETLLGEAAAREQETRRLHAELLGRWAALEAEGGRLREDLEKARAWVGGFLARTGQVEELAARMEKAMAQAAGAEVRAAANAEAAGQALSLAETATTHLAELAGSLAALAELHGEGRLLAARLAGDRLRAELRGLGRPAFAPAPHPDGRTPAAGEPPAAIRCDLDGQLLVFIPAGEMVLGDEEGAGEADERPAGAAASGLAVRLTRSFYAGRTEVANGAYERFLQATGHPAPPHWGGSRCPAELREYPVVCVSWADAQAYCAWAGLRLLTEAEWEYCAKSPWQGRSAGPWPWGKASPASALANFDPAPPLRLQQRDWRFWLRPTGSQPEGKSAWGLLDLAGNAAEWVQDWYRESWYTTLSARQDTLEDPAGPPFGLGRVHRGGSWCSSELALRSSAREMAAADSRYTFLGFRCALDAAAR